MKNLPTSTTPCYMHGDWWVINLIILGQKSSSKNARNLHFFVIKCYKVKYHLVTSNYVGVSWILKEVAHKEIQIILILLVIGLKDDVLPETLSSLKIVLPEKKSSLTLDPLKQMVIITP